MLARSLFVSLFAIAALCAGCAQVHSSAMGAGTQVGTVCRDGTILAPNSPCTMHGGAIAGSATVMPSTGR